jgi:hypothetical protein
MGLDMYLYGKKFLWNDSEEQKKVHESLPKINRKPKEVVFELMYWRKANAIHNWFVENVQSGEDNCEEYPLYISDLQKLKESIEKALLTPAMAGEVLPTSTGFFFGSTDYDDLYFAKLEDTKNQLEEILNDPELSEMDFYYSSSW